MLTPQRATSAPTLPAALTAAARAFSGTHIIMHSTERPGEPTLGELWDEAVKMAAHLRELGIEPGDVVAVQLPIWRECLVVHAATWLAGAVLLPIVPIYGPHEIEFILRRSGARVFVAPRTWRGRDNGPLFEAVADVPSLSHRLVVGEPLPGTTPFSALTEGVGHSGHGGQGGHGFVPYVPSGPDERCLLVYTSGTTAEPKGVQHTHASLLGEVRAMEALRADRPETSSLAVFPAGHIAGTLGILRALLRGTLTVTMDAWDPVAAAHLIARHRIGNSAGAPIHLNGLLDAADAEGLDLSCLQEYTTGAANVAPGLIARADRSGIKAFRCYGSTEHPTISSGVPDDPIDKRATTDGRPTPGTEVRIVDGQGHDVPPGTDGEILSRGPELFTGYTGRALNEASFVDGWFRTGDIGRLDPDGYLTITDRKKDIIIRGGENISSKEVEDLLLTHPAVAQAAAVGAPDERYGERVCAFVVLRQGHDLDLGAVGDFFQARGLARQKTPERLEIVAELPRTASGKVQKQALREALR